MEDAMNHIATIVLPWSTISNHSMSITDHSILIMENRMNLTRFNICKPAAKYDQFKVHKLKKSGVREQKCRPPESSWQSSKCSVELQLINNPQCTLSDVPNWENEFKLKNNPTLAQRNCISLSNKSCCHTLSKQILSKKIRHRRRSLHSEFVLPHQLEKLKGLERGELETPPSRAPTTGNFAEHQPPKSGKTEGNT